MAPHYALHARSVHVRSRACGHALACAPPRRRAPLFTPFRRPPSARAGQWPDAHDGQAQRRVVRPLCEPCSCRRRCTGGRRERQCRRHACAGSSARRGSGSSDAKHGALGAPSLVLSMELAEVRTVLHDTFRASGAFLAAFGSVSAAPRGWSPSYSQPCCVCALKIGCASSGATCALVRSAEHGRWSGALQASML